MLGYFSCKFSCLLEMAGSLQRMFFQMMQNTICYYTSIQSKPLFKSFQRRVYFGCHVGVQKVLSKTREVSCENHGQSHLFDLPPPPQPKTITPVQNTNITFIYFIFIKTYNYKLQNVQALPAFFSLQFDCLTT